MKTYEKILGFTKNTHFIQRSMGGKGNPPYWPRWPITVRKVYEYEVLGKHAV